MHASVVELEEYLGRSFRPSEYPTATRALIEASSRVDDACDVPFGVIEDDVYEVLAPIGQDLQLPGPPISVIDAVVTIDADGAEQTVPVLQYVDFADGTLRRLTGGWGGPVMRVRVTYTHGPEVTPEAIRSVTLASAARQIVNPAGIESESLGDLRTTFALNEGHSISLTDAELRRLERAGYRRSLASIPIGR